MHSPEALLVGCAERDLGGGGGMRMDTGERKVDEDPMDLARGDIRPVKLRKGLQCELTAVGTLEIRHFVDRHGSLGRSLTSALQGNRIARGILTVESCRQRQHTAEHCERK